MPEEAIGEEGHVQTTQNIETISKASKHSDNNEYDIGLEEKHESGQVDDLPDLQRRLKSRHLAMIAIGE